MENQSFVSIQEAAAMVGKSVQTLRRLIKKGDLKAKRVKTPQGFSYVIELQDLPKEEETMVFYNSPIQKPTTPQQQAIYEPTPIQDEILTSRNPIVAQADEDFYLLDIQKSEKLHNNKELLKLLDDSHREKIFLMTLIQKLQEELRSERAKRDSD